MRHAKSRVSGITTLPDGRTRAVAYHDSSPELKKEIMQRIPDDMRDAIKATAEQFGRLHMVGVKWRESS